MLMLLLSLLRAPFPPLLPSALCRVDFLGEFFKARPELQGREFFVTGVLGAVWWCSTLLCQLPLPLPFRVLAFAH